MTPGVVYGRVDNPDMRRSESVENFILASVFCPLLLTKVCTEIL